MNKKSLWISLTVLIAIVIGVGVFKILNPSVGFEYYEPSYLPPNVSIKAKRITIFKGSPAQVEQNFRTEDWVYAIREYKGYSSIGSAEQNYDDKSIKPTCNIETSSAGTKYRLCHWIDYGKIDVHEVKFNKGTTFIYAQIPTQTNQKVSIQEINKFVDSFKAKSTARIPVLRASRA